MGADPSMGFAADPRRCGYYGHVTNAGNPCGGWLVENLKACKRHLGKTMEHAKAEVISRRLFSQVDMPAPVSGVDAIEDALARIHQVVLFLAEKYGDGTANEGEREEYRRWLETQARVGNGKLQARVDEVRAQVLQAQGAGIVAVLAGALGRLGQDVNDVRVREAVSETLAALTA